MEVRLYLDIDRVDRINAVKYIATNPFWIDGNDSGK